MSVCVHRQWHRTYIACGSNLGEREQFIESAVRSMCNHPSCRVLQESELLQSTPYGMEEQGEFVNGVVEMDTLLPPMELLDYLHTLEQIAGRERTAHWGPRTLDLDILLYDDFIIDTETLTIPHPDMSNRDFVLQPLAELAGYMRHPLTHLTIQEMLTDLQRRMIAHIKQ
ncbi:MAG: 2-amino-4-hydroxy-6-hydroxymethyldihydropteridine diphosphokinase [Lachnospiraceae bacterium]